MQSEQKGMCVDGNSRGREVARKTSAQTSCQWCPILRRSVVFLLRVKIKPEPVVDILQPSSSVSVARDLCSYNCTILKSSSFKLQASGFKLDVIPRAVSRLSGRLVLLVPGIPRRQLNFASYIPRTMSRGRSGVS